MVAVILAGGLSRRMGGVDKAGLHLVGRPLCLHVAARVAPQVTALALNAPMPADEATRFGLPVLPDPVPGRPGPLAGLLAALRWAESQGAEQVLTVPVDTPFLPGDLVARLSAAGAPSLAASGGRRHWTVGLWPVGLSSALSGALEDGVRAVRDWPHAARAARVDWSESGPGPFFNVNTPEDLAAAERWLADMP